MPLSTPVRALCSGIGALGLTLAALTIAPRIGWPWPLEWMEGASLHHALRLARGLPLYAAPSAEFVPYLYPPLAYLPMALALSLFGPSLWVGRLVSVLAFAGTLACLGRIAARGSGSAAIGCGAAGLFALGFGYTGAFLDLVRVDAVFLLLVSLGLERLHARAIPSGLAWLVLGCFAKQHGLLFLAAAWAGIGLAPGEPKRLQWILASAGLLALGVLAVEAWSGGWFLRYTWVVPAGHGIVPELLASYLGIDVLVYTPALAGFVALWMLRGGARERSNLPALCWLAAGLAASALGRAHPGGDDNVRLPGFALLVTVGMLAFAWLWSNAPRALVRRLLAAALALQALWLLQLPAAHAPRPEQAHAFSSLTAAVARCAAGSASSGVALDHALLTGRPFVHTMALSDLQLSSDRDLSTRAVQALTAALARSDAPPSLALSASFPALEDAVAQRYAPCDTLGALRLPTGYALGPTRVYRLRPPP